MKVRNVSLTLLLIVTTLLANDRTPSAAEASPGATQDAARIRFQITTVEEHGDERNVISEASVEGPAGTDFNINLQGEPFKMSARFITDLVRPGALRVRAKLDTRRLYGYSERRLPLYEEDAQVETLEVGFDEALVLLPFGRGGDRRLKIEITPAPGEQSARLPSGEARPLDIKILKQSPGGSIRIEASKTPHRFTVEALLLEDGREVARAASNQFVEEAQEFVLRPNDQASAEVTANPPALRLSVENYTRSRPVDQVALGFDIYRADGLGGGGRREPVGLNWAGAGGLGSSLTYDLPGYLPASGRKYQLKLNVRLADGERAD